MSKRESLRLKLKSADRRRQRRSGEAPAPTVEMPSSNSQKVDVTGMVVEAILEHAGVLGSDARDAMVIAALHSVLRGTTPSGEDARRLAEQLHSISRHSEVSLRAFRDTLEQLLLTANAHHVPRNGNGFLRYLTVLSE